MLIGTAITGFLLSFILIRRIPGEPLARAVIATAAVTVVSITVLLLARVLSNRIGWARPHPVIVVSALILASLVRSASNWLYANRWSGGQEIDTNPVGRSVSSLIIFVVLGLIMGASAQLAHERTEANTALLIEQARLRQLIENADAELHRSEIDLRTRAHSLLQPTVEEIRELISGEISESAAHMLAERIDVAVNEVVRPASRELALSPLAESEQIVSEATPSLSLLRDRIDITLAIRPGWLMFVWWVVLLPGVIALGAQSSGLARSFILGLIFWPIIWAIKLLWPRRFRNMPVALGLGILLIVYSVLNIGFQFFLPSGGQAVTGSETWVANVQVGIIIRVALAMLVSILAMLNVHGEQIRASLIETNAALEELISRIKRETWLLHRSVSLAVHGPMQSALISTAMRLSAAHRTPEIVADARRRLEEALTALTAEQNESASLSLALEDLQGLWSSVVQISFEVEPLAQQRVAVDIGLSRCVIEICREATSNAIRHGHATAIAICITTAEDLIEIKVTDDGDGISSVKVAGLGSQMFDETCLRWSITNDADGGSELIAVVA